MFFKLFYVCIVLLVHCPPPIPDLNLFGPRCFSCSKCSWCCRPACWLESITWRSITITWSSNQEQSIVVVVLGVDKIRNLLHEGFEVVIRLEEAHPCVYRLR